MFSFQKKVSIFLAKIGIHPIIGSEDEEKQKPEKKEESIGSATLKTVGRRQEDNGEASRYENRSQAANSPSYSKMGEEKLRESSFRHQVQVADGRS